MGKTRSLLLYPTFDPQLVNYNLKYFPMKVFVTGATGFVGSIVVQQLLEGGHQVIGLARSDASARSLEAAGVEVHRGSIGDLDSLRRGAEQADGVIHTAFDHDFSKFKANSEADRHAIEALGAALAGSERSLIITSAIGILASGQLVREDDRPPADSPNPRVASEEAADAVASRGVRVAVVRLPPSVHGEGDHAFVPTLIHIAREKGMAVYQGDGNNHWPAVHRFDAARVYRLALELDFTPGTRFHAVAEEGVPFRQIAEVIGQKLDVPVVAKSPEEAAEYFGSFAHFAALNLRADSKQTRHSLSWQPKYPGLIADLEGSSYFPS